MTLESTQNTHFTLAFNAKCFEFNKKVIITSKINDIYAKSRIKAKKSQTQIEVNAFFNTQSTVGFV